MSFPIYEIRTVCDFLKVPPNRLEACLSEFQKTLEDLAAKYAGSEIRRWIWIDDGKPNQYPVFVTRNSKQPEAKECS